MNSNEITSEFKISNGDNVGDTITGIVPIEHEGREVLGFFIMREIITLACHQEVCL